MPRTNMKRTLFSLTAILALTLSASQNIYAENVFKEFGKDMKHAGKQIGKTGKNVGKSIGRTSKKVGKSIGKAAKDIVD